VTFFKDLTAFEYFPNSRMTELQQSLNVRWLVIGAKVLSAGPYIGGVPQQTSRPLRQAAAADPRIPSVLFGCLQVDSASARCSWRWDRHCAGRQGCFRCSRTHLPLRSLALVPASAGIHRCRAGFARSGFSLHVFHQPPNMRLKLAAPSRCGSLLFVKSSSSRRSLGAPR
jgi:hypothetical protein